MGKSSKTNSTQNTVGTTSLTQTPTNPSWVDSGLAGLGANVNNLSTADPFSFIAGPDPLQTQAGQGAAGLTSPQGFTDAASIANGVAGSGNPSISSHLAEFQNPYTNDVVNTTLAGFDQNAGYSRAGDQLARAGDSTFGGSGGAIQTALNEQNIAQGRAQTEAQLRDQGFQTALGGATSQAGMDAQGQAQRLNAANLLSSNASAQGANAQGNIATQSAIGTLLQQLAQQKAASPLGLMATQAGLYGSMPLSLLHGQDSNGTENTTTTGNSKTSVNDPMGTISSLMSGAGSLASGLAMFSDERLKTDIETVGHDAKGRRWVDWNYIWDPTTRHRGVIAQEVAKTDPQAVQKGPNGFLTVDYGKL